MGQTAPQVDTESAMPHHAGVGDPDPRRTSGPAPERGRPSSDSANVVTPPPRQPRHDGGGAPPQPPGRGRVRRARGAGRSSRLAATGHRPDAGGELGGSWGLGPRGGAPQTLRTYVRHYTEGPVADAEASAVSPGRDRFCPAGPDALPLRPTLHLGPMWRDVSPSTRHHWRMARLLDATLARRARPRNAPPSWERRAHAHAALAMTEPADDRWPATASSTSTAGG